MCTMIYNMQSAVYVQNITAYLTLSYKFNTRTMSKRVSLLAPCKNGKRETKTPSLKKKQTNQ